jgi:glycosyltransferase involved in cell wall biosynthesis
MSPIRVGLSTTMIEPAVNNGHLDGIGVYTNALTLELPEAGCTVQGYSFPQLGKPDLSQKFSAGKPMQRSFEWQTLRDIAWRDRLQEQMPVDVYHATDYRIVRMSCPVVATLHDAIPLKFPEWCSPRFRSLKNWLQKSAARRADQVIALSTFAVAELVEYFDIDARRITVVPCGVGTEWLVAPPADAVGRTLTAYGLQSGYFLFVGTLQPRKNIERILDAYLGLSPVLRRERQLVIVGHPGSRCDALIQKMQAAIQNGENIVWLNQLTKQHELRHIYAGAGVFVFPSLYEGFGIPVAEAFAAGVPVLTSNTTSLPEVSKGAALEIDPLSTSSIGEAMQALARDEGLRTRCIAAGRLRAAELSWQRTAVETVAVYDCALGR